MASPSSEAASWTVHVKLDASVVTVLDSVGLVLQTV